jgi:hypothetical protein
MHPSLRLALALTLLVAPSFAVGAEKEDPKKFK